MDSVLDETDNETQIDAPKTIERLEDISSMRAMQRQLDELESDDDDLDNIKISNDAISLTDFDILDNPSTSNNYNDDIILNDVEELI